MLLRQALEQTRAGMPPPILFNTRMVGLEPADEAMQDVFDLHFHAAHNRSSRSLHRGSAGIENFSSLPHRKAATAVTGAHPS